MDLWRSVLALLLASLVIMGSPGPSTISVTAVGAAYGFRRSLTYAGGLIVGTSVVLCGVAIGVVAFLLAIPHGASVLVSVSAVYILYLAYCIATAPPLAAQRDQVAAPAFAGGFLLAIANPKAWLAIAAVFAASTLHPALRIVLLTGMIVVIHLAWLCAGVSLSRVLHHPVASRIINVALAASLVVVAVFGLHD